MAAIAAAVGVLAVPAAASAATKTVDMGTPISSQKAFQKDFADVNDFFPHGTTIHVGDSIKFVPTGLPHGRHPGQGRQAARPDRTGRQHVAGVIDAAGAPFWFNGQPTARLQPGPRAARALRQEGHLHRRQARRVRAAAVAEAEAVHGQVHQGRDVHVLLQHPRGDEGHGQGRVQEPQRPVGEGRTPRTLKTQVASTLKTAKPLTKTKVAAGNVSVGASGPRGVESYAMLPRDPDGPGRHHDEVPMSAKTFEVHTATFGPGNPETEPTSYLGDLANHFPTSPVFDRRGRVPERAAAGRSGGADPDAPRQRVLELRRPGRRQARRRCRRRTR